ncbi:mgtE-like transporter [Candidatus Hakubella thermalkaliphila]|uniref:MgtE-like transporter n=4 Tax=Candidatus Hakubella thermalkaliphila TaxID=2754717 RepID=A0A6V8Q6E3_9ACTN|nr:magnesium transporter [Candidatus Hakubella thermalkaliphila]GFP29597.1 mgtE-like transporter [Candidatus Hakubella thermalkaliphila]GFP32162.1 mgtE-like transporter [Candidatus Hakubella thermalkaliphila]GFP40177.1 mgtE-like transporter [Candidatus Hakubella thermalkaliphila]GFP42141.1 mgtE-like transporter [Candidatus Hakubella thermalkaliphila]
MIRSGRVATRAWAYLQEEVVTLKQGFVALLICSGGNLLAGLALGLMTHTLEALPGLMVLIPAAIGMRGNIFGALGSRLGTAIHSGIFELSRRREGILAQNIYVSTVLGLIMSLFLGILAWLVSLIFGLESISWTDFVVISTLGGIISGVVVLVTTVLIAVASYRWGWDADNVSTPLVTTAGDLVTIPSLYLATFVAGIPYVTPILSAILIVISMVSLIMALFSGLNIVYKVLLESLPTLLLAGLVVILAGVMVESRIKALIALPALLVMIPLFIDNSGNMGGILSARLASKLHLGLINSHRIPEPAAWREFGIIYIFGGPVFTMVGVTSHLVSRLVGLGSPGLLEMVGISLVAGLMTTTLAILVAYYIAVGTFRFGLDPDNHGIPAVTSSMDFLGIFFLIFTMVLFGLV